MSKKNTKTIILGAGLAGLSASYHSGFPVYEAKNRVGGISDSISKKGYVFDYGIHILQSKIKYFLDLMKKLNVDLADHHRKALIYSFNSYSAYPFQINTSHLPLFLRLQCIGGYLFRNKKLMANNYHDWIIKYFGKGFAKTFLIPYSEKFWRFSTKNMTFEWTNNRVPIPKFSDLIKGAFKDQILKVGTNPIFQYPAKKGEGFGGIPLGFTNKLKNINLNMEATSIDTEKKIIIFNNKKKLKYDYLISTIPLPEIIKIIKNVPIKIKNLAKKLKFNSIASINLGINRKDINENHWIHYPEKNISFFRISFPNNFGNRISPENTSMIQAEISYDINNPPKKNEAIEYVYKDLIKTKVILPTDKITFSDIIYMKYAYVIYDKLRNDIVKDIHDFLKNNSIYPTGRFGKWEYLWSDQSCMSGKETVEEIIKKNI